MNHSRNSELLKGLKNNDKYDFPIIAKNRRINALLNIGAENNFIFQQLTVEINLPSERVNGSEITVNKYKIYIYDRHQLSTVTIDSHRK
jgi:hypothetical protein